MNREEIKERLIELCGEIFRDEGIDLGLIKYVDFYNDLGMDSISFISMIVEMLYIKRIMMTLKYQ